MYTGGGGLKEVSTHIYFIAWDTSYQVEGRYGVLCLFDILVARNTTCSLS